MTLSIACVALCFSGTPASLLTLDDALQQASANSHDLEAARARLQAARQTTGKVWANYLPTVTAGASYTRNSGDQDVSLQMPTGYWLRDIGPNENNGPVGDPNVPGAPSETIMMPSGMVDLTIQKVNQLGAQLQATQPLIVPALWPAIDSAYTVERAAEYGTEAARREILFATTQLYFGVVSLQEAVAIQRQMLDTQKAHEKDNQVRFASGAVPKIALLRAQIDRSKAEQDLKRAENAFEGARFALASMIGKGSIDFSVVKPSLPPMPTDLADMEQKAEDLRPDLKASALMLEVAENSRASSWWAYAPNVFLNGVYSLSNVKGFTGSYQNWAISIAASWTLLDGFGREATIRESSAKVAEARASHRAAQTKAAIELRQAALELDSARSNRQKAEETVKLARENLQLVEVSVKSGAVTPLELSDATTAVSGAELTLLAETLNADLAALKLLKAAGAYNP